MGSKLQYCESDGSPLRNSRGLTRNLAFSSNGLWLAGAVANYAVIWNLETGGEFFSLDGQRGNEARSVFWLANCATVYCAFSTGWVYTIHLDGKNFVIRSHSVAPLEYATMHPNGLWLATHNNLTTSVWRRENHDLDSGWNIYTTLLLPANLGPATARMVSVSWIDIPEVRNLVVTYQNHGIITWDVHENAQPVAIRHLITGEILAADISPNGDKVVVFHKDVGFKVYNTSSYVTIASFPITSNPGLQPLVGFAHRGRAILGSFSHQAKLYRLNGETYSTFDILGALRKGFGRLTLTSSSPFTVVMSDIHKAGSLQDDSPIIALTSNYDEETDTFRIAVASGSLIKLWETVPTPIQATPEILNNHQKHSLVPIISRPTVIYVLVGMVIAFCVGFFLGPRV